LRDKRRMHI